MNPHLTEIAYILDRSGSMQPMQEPAVAAFNDFVKSQLDVPGDARLSANVSFSMKGIKSTGGAMARKVRAIRMKSGGNMDAQAMEDDAKSMNDIVKEEEQK
jgi:hypothetical protein